MAAPYDKKRKSKEFKQLKKEQDQERSRQIYNQVALHQSKKSITNLKDLFAKHGKTEVKITAKKKEKNKDGGDDDKKEDIAYNLNETWLSHNGLLRVFKECGIVQLNNDKAKQKLLYKHFDLDENGTIDYDELSSNMTAMVSGDDEETLYLLFQLFDHNDDGYLDRQDLTSLFLFQNFVSMMVIKKQEQEIILTKKEIAKIVDEMFKSVDDNDDNKMSFKEYTKLMKDRDHNKYLIDKQKVKK